MPQRFLRPGITNSDAWNAVSFGAQSFYVRIMTLVDDYGRYDGRIQILHSHCFALRPDVTVKHSAAFRSELQTSGLILVYQVDGKEYIEITKWQERARGPSKYPAPQESAGIRSGAQPNPASLAIVPSPSPSPTPTPKVVVEFEEFWKAYPRKVGIEAARKKFDSAIKKTTIQKIILAISAQKKTDQWRKDGGQFIPHPATWLNQGRWDDVPKIEALQPAQQNGL